MNKPVHKNAVNVNIAIHIPNQPSSYMTNGLTIGGSQNGASVEYGYETQNSALDPAKFKDVVEISPKARKLAEKQNKRT